MGVRRAGCVYGIVTALVFGADPARTEETAENSALEAFEASRRIDDAQAQLGEVLAPSAPPRFEGMFGDFLAYAGIDAWRYGGSVYSGADWTHGLFVARLFAADGIDDFRTATTAYRSETVRASLLGGLRLQSGKLDIKLFAGGDYMARIPLKSSTDPIVEKFGARLTIDGWWEPAAEWMVSGALSATTIESGVSGRLASGWRSSFAWIGPEVLATHDIYSTQLRAGGHVTGFKLGLTEWSLAGGYAHDSFGRHGPYGRISLTFRP